MKELTALNGNIMYQKNKDNKYVPVLELIIIVSEPDFQLTSAQTLSKARTTESHRIWVKDIKKLAEDLIVLQKELMDLETE